MDLVKDYLILWKVKVQKLLAVLFVEWQNTVKRLERMNTTIKCWVIQLDVILYLSC